jgi:hypothetical protein
MTDQINWISGECYYNAFRNKEKMEELFKRKFYVRIGGLGLSGWFEYGSKDPHDKNYKSKPNDSHAWLETADGFIVDFTFKRYADVCDVWGLPIKFPIKKMVCGTRETLKKKYGLEFVPTTMSNQEYILNHITKNYEMRFKFGMMPRVEFNPKLIEFY